MIQMGVGQKPRFDGVSLHDLPQKGQILRAAAVDDNGVALFGQNHVGHHKFAGLGENVQLGLAHKKTSPVVGMVLF